MPCNEAFPNYSVAMGIKEKTHKKYLRLQSVPFICLQNHCVDYGSQGKHETDGERKHTVEKMKAEKSEPFLNETKEKGNSLTEGG